MGNSQSLKKIKKKFKNKKKLKIDNFSSNKIIILLKNCFSCLVLKKNNCNILYILGGVLFKTIPYCLYFSEHFTFYRRPDKKI